MATIVYLDISGSIREEQMIAALKTVTQNARLKFFDTQVWDSQTTVGQFLTDRRRKPLGGGTLVGPVLADFKATGADNAVIVGDTFFGDISLREVLATPNVKFVNVEEF
jgi:hypothetical protein